VSAKKKARIAFFDFTCCEGCQVELTNVGQDVMLGLLDHVEIVEMREVTSSKTTEPIDIALIEGSFTREEDRARLEEIRKRAAVVIAYGACATTAGINALKNHQADYAPYVYGKDAGLGHLASQAAQPVSAAIPVDYFVHGCPIDRNELVYILSSLLHGKDPVIPNHPVCVECKMRETVCRYHVGDHCLGLVARAGCGAPCPADGIPCEACRGFVDQPNHDALVEVLMDKGGLPAERARTRSLMFTAAQRSDAR
jgi:coenzyme F420-reducing hydrogenase gamma subunit